MRSPMRAIAILWLAALCAAAPTRVHIIFSNHLDVGFHSNLPNVPGDDSAVLTRYFKDYFPAAIATAAALRSRGGPERYVYLTHSWLVSLYLDCPAKLGVYCPTPAELAAFEAAVAGGDITWHALPHNFQAEFMDVELLQYAVQLAHDLDQRFGLPPKRTMSQRDVPGLTRAAVPVLAGAGVAALSVGVNSGSAPPGVPKFTPFVWRDEGSGASLLAFWRPGGYSGEPVDPGNECVAAPGLDEVLCAAWNGDNAGPHTVDQVLDVFDRVRADFPVAAVAASTFDAFVAALEAAVAGGLALPVVTQEIGDTWVYGVASDPAKVAEFRALLRLRRAEADRWDEPAFHAFSRLLLKVPEHTWGTDTKEDPGDYQRWDNAALAGALSGGDPRFAAAVASWRRQRAYCDWAAEELGPTGAAALEGVRRLRVPPRPSGDPAFALAFSASPAAGQAQGLAAESAKATEHAGSGGGSLDFGSDSWRVRLDPGTGAISGLWFLGAGGGGSGGPACALAPLGGGGGGGACGASWASPASPLAALSYSTYDEASYDTIWDHYAHRRSPFPDWFIRDFSKPNATVVGGATRRDAVPSLKKVWHRADSEEGGLKIVAQMEFDPGLVAQAGAPAAVHLEITSPAGSPDLFVDLIWENKTATRLPEAMWFGFQPPVSAVDPSSWRMSKLRQWVSPLEVMRNGSQSMHGVDDDGVSVASADGTALLRIRSLDAALVSPGRPTPFPSVVDPPDLTQGMHFCLVNNVWGTNYVMWFPYQEEDRNLRFRFILQVESAVAEA